MTLEWNILLSGEAILPSFLSVISTPTRVVYSLFPSVPFRTHLFIFSPLLPPIHTSVFFPHPLASRLSLLPHVHKYGRTPILEVWKYDWKMRRDYAYWRLVRVLYDSVPPVSFPFLDRAVRRTRPSDDGFHASFEYQCSRDRALSKITPNRTRSRHKQDHQQGSGIPKRRIHTRYNYND